jgi:hypothetical protein
MLICSDKATITTQFPAGHIARMPCDCCETVTFWEGWTIRSLKDVGFGFRSNDLNAVSIVHV